MHIHFEPIEERRKIEKGREGKRRGQEERERGREKEDYNILVPGKMMLAWHAIEQVCNTSTQNPTDLSFPSNSWVMFGLMNVANYTLMLALYADPVLSFPFHL